MADDVKEVKVVGMDDPKDPKYVKVPTTANLRDENGKVVEKRKSLHYIYFGESPADFIEKYGEKAAMAMLVNGGKVDFQNKARYIMENKEGDEMLNELKSLPNDWVPGSKIEREKDVVGKALKQHATMSPDDQLRLVIATMRQTVLPNGKKMDDSAIAKALSIPPAKVAELSS